MKSVQKITEGEILAIDGKTLRGSYDTGSEKAAIHMINAWAVHNRLVMGQLKVDSKSNEITAIPELLKVLEIAGCIVTIDAMGCQKEIVKEIVRQKADYVITLKENQGNLYKDVEELLRIGMQREFQGLEYSKYTTKDVGHGREEIRHYVMISGIKSLLDINSDWENFNSVGMVEHIRKEKGETTVEIRYFISSLANNVEKFATAVRGHWRVENSLHWVLDVALNEDKCRIRKDNAPENFAVLRQIAVNLLGKEKRVKAGVKNKQFLAGIDEKYLMRVLSQLSAA